MFTSYAQNFEDVLLLRALRHIETGFYLDIGANDPTIDSVSLAFYERGWRGMNIEPDPEYAAKLRSERDRDTTIEAAISNSESRLNLHVFAGTGLTTSSDEYAKRHYDEGLESVELDVATRTLESLFDEIGSIDVHWLKIDVEGMEADVLESWRDHTARPWIVVVEATEPNSTDLNHETWESELANRDYSFEYFDGLNRFYLHEQHSDLREHFSTGPNLHDNFYLSHRSGFVLPLTEKLHEVSVALEHEKSAEQARSLKLAEIEAAQRNTLSELNSAQSARTALHKELEDTQLMLAEQKSTTERLEKLVLETKNKLHSSTQRFDTNIRKLQASLAEKEKELALEEAAQLSAVDIIEELMHDNDIAQINTTRLETSLAEASRHRDNAELMLENIHRSTSWRLTAPIRATKLASMRLTGRSENDKSTPHHPRATAQSNGLEDKQDPAIALYLTPQPEYLSKWQKLLNAKN